MSRRQVERVHALHAFAAATKPMPTVNAARVILLRAELPPHESTGARGRLCGAA